MLPESVMLDLKWWSSFIVMFNERVKVLKRHKDYIVAYSDWLNCGFGMYTGTITCGSLE